MCIHLYVLVTSPIRNMVTMGMFPSCICVYVALESTVFIFFEWKQIDIILVCSLVINKDG